MPCRRDTDCTTAVHVSPLRERQTRVLVVIWLHCYPLCREFEVHSYSLPLLLPRFSFAKYTHTFPYHTCCFRSPEATSGSFYSPPPIPSLCLSLSLFSISLPVFTIRNVHHPVQACCSPPLLDLATQIGEVSTLLHEITSLPLDFTSGENMPVRSPGNLRPCARSRHFPAPLRRRRLFSSPLDINLGS